MKYLGCCLGRGEESSEMDSRRVVRYPDSHQLFVGNLPHDIDEIELKDFFMSKLFFVCCLNCHGNHCIDPCSLIFISQSSSHLIVLCLPKLAFGNVVELRINTKGTGGKIPNFGFVVFDDSEPVQRILGVKVSKAICLLINVFKALF